MPKTYNLSNYPSHYPQLIQQVVAGQEVRVPFGSKQEATRARFNFYEFKKALRASTESHLVVLASEVEMVAIRFDGNALIYYNRDTSMENMAIGRALAALKAPIPGKTDEEIREEIERLSPLHNSDDLIQNFFSSDSVDSD